MSALGQKRTSNKSRPWHHLGGALAQNPSKLLPLLQRNQNPPLSGQRRAAQASNSERRHHQIQRDPGRTPPSIRSRLGFRYIQLRAQRINRRVLNLKIGHDGLVGLDTKPGASANKNGGSPATVDRTSCVCRNSVHHRATPPFPLRWAFPCRDV